MAKQRRHTTCIRCSCTITRSAACPYRRLAVFVVAALLFAVWPAHLWAHTIATERRPAPAERSVPYRLSSSRVLEFTRFPSDAEITQARVFSMPLLPIEAAAAAPRGAFVQDNRALADALLAYAQATETDDVSALTAFLEAHPQSRWRAGLLAHLGRIYRHSGLFQDSIEAFEKAWALTRHGTDRYAQTIANWAIGELADLHTHMGHTTRLKELAVDLGSRQLYGPATEQWTAAVESLLRRQQQVGPQAACGIMALTHLLRRESREVTPALLAAYASHDDMSLLQVNAVAQQSGLQLQMAKRQDGAPIPVPAVMHWQRGHYSAIVERQEHDGKVRYLVENPLAQEAIWIRQEVLDAESSGYFLIPTSDLPTGFQPASRLEAEGVWGRCWDGRQDQEQTSEYAIKICPRRQPGVAVYSFHAMLVSLNIVDEPIGYTPPLGPPVTFRVTYNQRDAFLPPPDMFTFGNLGPKWTFAFLSYVTQHGGEVTVYLRGGGQERHTFGAPFTDPKSLGIHYQSQAELIGMQRSGLYFARYERLLPDGSREVFALPDGATSGERRTFLTEIVDPAGNAVKLTYDAQRRVVAVTDAIGQVTRMAYELPGEPLKITRVTDPFGRSATFAYDTQGRLITITDVIGLTSQFTYAGDFITSMTTPYGTTTFRTGVVDNPTPSDLRWLEATDPLGDTERLETPFRLAPNQPPVQATAYWDKRAWRAGGRDFTKARLFHWMVGHPGSHIMLGIPWRVKPPLENEVVYTYPSCSGCGVSDLRPQAQGADGLPTTISRRLDDGTTQTYQFVYNERGYVTKTADPAGRAFSFAYASNGIDLLGIFNDNTRERLARFTYDDQHLPLTFTDAAGHTTTFTYNPQGQVLTVTNAQGETTTSTYNAQGYLAKITGPLPAALTRYTYDDFGRMHTVTDAAGYQLTFVYDKLDRLTRITYPDGTFERIRYGRLEAVQFTDRQGRITRLRYDALRRPVTITDPLGRSTRLRWCDCGSLEQLIDPAGNVTTWEHDLQGQVITKTLADGATTRYVYAHGSGRLQQMIDPKGQSTTYTYTIDDNLRRMAFQNADIDTDPITFTYDPDYDRLVRVQDGIGTTHYAYHPIGERGALQVASVTGQLPGSQVDYAYDELGRVVRRSINGVASVLTYDVLGRVSRLRNALGIFRLSYVGATERMQSIAYPNGQETVLSYFGVLGDHRLRRLRHKSPAGSVLSQFDYTYETTGEIQTQGRYQPELRPARATYRYRYDAASQLLAARLEDRTGASLNTYGYDYDAAGNRTGEDVGTSHRAASFNNVNQLVSMQRGKKTWDFTYDANGNLLSDGARTYEWDARDRLTAIVSGNRRSEFSYDGFDRRVRIVEKENDNVISDVWLLWCGSDICEQRSVNKSGSLTRKRFFSHGETDVGRVHFYTWDHLGSIRQMTNNAGAVVASYDYDPYGRRRRVQDEETAAFGYASYFWHAASGLNLMQFRAYAPHLGRWLSRDPIEEAGGSNLYGYVGNSPINLVDPSGLRPWNGFPEWLKPKLPTLSPTDVLPFDDAGIIRVAPSIHQTLWAQLETSKWQLKPLLKQQARLTKQKARLDPNDPQYCTVNDRLYVVNTRVEELSKQVFRLGDNVNTVADRYNATKQKPLWSSAPGPRSLRHAF